MVFKLTIISCFAAALLLCPALACDSHGHGHHDHAVVEEEQRNLQENERCGTPDLTDDQRLQAREAIAVYQASNPSFASRLDGDPCPVTIDTVVAVITKSNGAVGSLSAVEIADQMDVMNDAFAPAGFVFNLREPPHYYDNAAWYSDCRTSEADMKTTIRKDIDSSDTGNKKDVLYIYICTPGSKLGYGTFPFFDYGFLDGVMLIPSSLPGGSSTNYGEGYTANHEVCNCSRSVGCVEAK